LGRVRAGGESRDALIGAFPNRVRPALLLKGQTHGSECCSSSIRGRFAGARFI